MGTCKSQDDVLNEKMNRLIIPTHPVLGYCISVYDGDTVNVNFKTEFGTHEWPVRLKHFDAPELKTKDPQEKIQGQACRDVVKKLIEKRHVIIIPEKFEKYRRVLANIYFKLESPTNHWWSWKSSTIPTDFSTHLPMVGEALAQDVKNFQKLISHESKKKEIPLDQIPSGYISLSEFMLKYTPCVPYEGATKNEINYTEQIWPPWYNELVEIYSPQK